MNQASIEDRYEITSKLGETCGELVAGCKVRYVGADDFQVQWGSNDDPRELLTECEMYTVAEVEVHTWHTKIYLEECPGKRFNSVSFDVVATCSE